jgi:hypothetical protein
MGAKRTPQLHEPLCVAQLVRHHPDEKDRGRAGLAALDFPQNLIESVLIEHCGFLQGRWSMRTVSAASMTARSCDTQTTTALCPRAKFRSA